MATLKEIAKIANVNVSTVSKALHDSSDLNEQTKITIRAIADQLGYAYSAEAKHSGPPLVGVIFPDVMSNFYMAVLNSLHDHLLKVGYRMLIMTTGFSEKEEYICLKELLRNRVCAVLCFSAHQATPPRFRALAEKSNLPFLIVSHTEADDFCDIICTDVWKGAVMAAEHLVELGHRKIAYVGEPLSVLRRQAWETALKAKGIPVPSGYIVENDMRFEACGYEGMKALLNLPERPTGVFAAYDSIAIGAMRAINEAGLRIPEDISIVSVDDSNVGNYLNVRLTTITEPTQDLGELAAELLTMKIEGKRKVVQNVKLQPTLKIRESTAPPCEDID